MGEAKGAVPRPQGGWKNLPSENDTPYSINPSVWSTGVMNSLLQLQLGLLETTDVVPSASASGNSDDGLEMWPAPKKMLSILTQREPQGKIFSPNDLGEQGIDPRTAPS